MFAASKLLGEKVDERKRFFESKVIPLLLHRETSNALHAPSSPKPTSRTASPPPRLSRLSSETFEPSVSSFASSKASLIAVLNARAHQNLLSSQDSLTDRDAVITSLSLHQAKHARVLESRAAEKRSEIKSASEVFEVIGNAAEPLKLLDTTFRQMKTQLVIPDEIQVQQVKAGIATRAAHYLEDLAVCIELTGKLKKSTESITRLIKQPAAWSKNAALDVSDALFNDCVEFAELKKRLLNLPSDTKTWDILMERQTILCKRLTRLFIVVSGQITLPNDPSLNASEEPLIPIKSNRQAIHKILAGSKFLENEGDLPVACITALIKPITEKFERQFFLSPPLARIDKPDWPLRRCLEILNQLEHALTLDQEESSVIMPSLQTLLSVAMATVLRDFYLTHRWPAVMKDESLMSGYLGFVIQAHDEWRKISSASANAWMIPFLHNQLGLLDAWIHSDLSYCRKQMTPSIKVTVLLELLQASIPRIRSLLVESSVTSTKRGCADRLLNEAYNQAIHESVQSYKREWNELPGTLEDAKPCSVILSAVSALAHGVKELNMSLGDEFQFSAEAERISHQMLSRLVNFITDELTRGLYRIYQDPGLFIRTITNPILVPYKQHLSASAWMALSLMLEEAFDQELVRFLQHSSINEQDRASFRSNIECLGMNLPLVQRFISDEATGESFR